MLYPEGIPHKESTMEARSIVVGTLGKAEGEARNKEIRKKVIKLAKRLTRVAEEGGPFSSRMVQVYKDHPDLIGRPACAQNFSAAARPASSGPKSQSPTRAES